MLSKTVKVMIDIYGRSTLIHIFTEYDGGASIANIARNFAIEPVDVMDCVHAGAAIVKTQEECREWRKTIIEPEYETH